MKFDIPSRGRAVISRSPAWTLLYNSGGTTTCAPPCATSIRLEMIRQAINLRNLRHKERHNGVVAQ
jgi:hypothetical protein